MKIATKIIFASALTFSAVAPTFAHAAYLQNTSQIRQPINQVITFPQISTIWASTCRPIRMSNALRRFKPFSLSTIVESPVTP